jgi:hypothetical protein
MPKSLARKRFAAAKEAASAPPACVPRASANTFSFERYARAAALCGCRSVKLSFLGRAFRVVLIERLEHVAPAVATLGAAAGPFALDGEFDLVRGGGPEGRASQRMALLTLLCVGRSTLFAFHLPSLLAGWGGADGRWRAPLDASAPGGHEGVAQLLAFLRESPLVTWAGAGSDLPALRFALPALEGGGAGAAPFSRHVDLQVGVAARVRAGLLPPDTPLSLGKALISQCGHSLDKTLTISPWGAPPTAEMLAYAAADVISTSVLHKKSEDGTLFSIAPAAEAAAAGGAAAEVEASGAAPPRRAFSPADAVAAVWGTVLTRLAEISRSGQPPPGSAAALANQLVTTTSALSKIASAAPLQRQPLSAAVLARLGKERGLPAWVVALLL